MLFGLAAERPGARVDSCIVGVFVRYDKLLDGLPGGVHLGDNPARVVAHQHSAGRAALDLQPIVAQDAGIASPAKQMQPDTRAPPYSLPQLQRKRRSLLSAR